MRPAFGGFAWAPGAVPGGDSTDRIVGWRLLGRFRFSLFGSFLLRFESLGLLGGFRPLAFQTPEPVIGLSRHSGPFRQYGAVRASPVTLFEGGRAIIAQLVEYVALKSRRRHASLEGNLQIPALPIAGGVEAGARTRFVPRFSPGRRGFPPRICRCVRAPSRIRPSALRVGSSIRRVRRRRCERTRPASRRSAE